MKWLRQFKITRGVTLFELIVTVVIIGILAAIGVPSFEKMSRNRELKNAGETLYSILNGIRAWQLQHPEQLLLPGAPRRDTNYWVGNWKTNLANKYLGQMSDATPNDPNLLTIVKGSRKIEYNVRPGVPPNSNDLLSIWGVYSVNNVPQGYVYLSYNGQLFTQNSVPSGSCGNGTVEIGEQCDGNPTSLCGGFLCTSSCVCSGAGGGTCGNGTVEGGEQCDDGNTTPGDGCSTICRNEVCGDGVVNSSEQCESSSQCPPLPALPQSGHSYVCASCQCVDIPPGGQFCGDGALTSPPELCDPGLPPLISQVSCSGGTCASDCLSCCGDGNVTGTESCDILGNTGCGSIVGSVCNSTCSGCACPAGQVESNGHCCPSGQIWNGTTCSLCGDGVIDSGEACDPGASNGTPENGSLGCPYAQICDSSSCTSCDCAGGEHISHGGHCCPDQQEWNGLACSYCGNWQLDPGEGCDESAGWSCFRLGGSTLALESFSNKELRSLSELLDSINWNDTAQLSKAPAPSPPPICRDCQCVSGPAVCGNGLLESGEECDDSQSPPMDGDGCSSVCLWEFCGDGIMNFDNGQPEVCDGSDGCSAPTPNCLPDCSACVGCWANWQCDNGNICDGVETCNLATNTCNPPPPNAPAGTSCANTNQCDGAETCDGNGNCVPGAPIVCAPPSAVYPPLEAQCRKDGACQPFTGNCFYDTNYVFCNDGNVCTQTDSCNYSGPGLPFMCIGSNPINCDDSDPCTADSCDPVTGCVNAPLTGNSCDDAVFCNGADTCNAGVCQHQFGPGNPRCPDDGLFCTGTESCDEVNDQCVSSGNQCPALDPLEPVCAESFGDHCKQCTDDSLLTGSISPQCQTLFPPASLPQNLQKNYCFSLGESFGENAIGLPEEYTCVQCFDSSYCGWLACTPGVTAPSCSSNWTCECSPCAPSCP